jgi:tetratricopeptide (TPR) repeat protein
MYGSNSMTRNATNTRKRADVGQASVDSPLGPEPAASFAEQADEILGGYLRPGGWSTSGTAQRFVASGDLERVLSLYLGAMEHDPMEAAHPWNLASSLDRLQLPDLALPFMRRAIRVADDAGDHEWAGADAYLALADIAINAGQHGTARAAIEQAHKIDPAAPVERYRRRLREQRSASNGTTATLRRARSTLSRRVVDELAVLEREEALQP